MVFLTIFRLGHKKATHSFREGFRDSLKITAIGGKGGNGIPKYGGWGGQGGNVKVVAKDKINLNDVFKKNRSKRYVAKNGTHSNPTYILGEPGDDITFEVPVGVSVSTTERKLGELTEVGQEIVVAEGGIGGKPDNKFRGQKGQERHIFLDLQLMADVGLVGFPNAGKSSLLKALSNAKPKVAEYTFTTIRPNLGVIQYPDFSRITVADLPGLIEGAWANKGMGHRFLKHVERTKINLLLLDVHGFQLGPLYPHRSCIECFLLLNKEMELYNEDLVRKPTLVVINKIDTPGHEPKCDEAVEQLKNLPEILTDFPENMRPEELIVPKDILFTAATIPNSYGIALLKKRLRTLVDEYQDTKEEDSTLP